MCENIFKKYQNLFITSRPGMGATTLLVNIINERHKNGDKILIFAPGDSVSDKFMDRIKVLNGEAKAEQIFPKSKHKYGNITVIDNNFLDARYIMNCVMEEDNDLIVIDESPCSKMSTREIVKLATQLKRFNRKFIFVTHLKRKISRITKKEINSPKVSHHRRAINCFDATMIVYREEYYSSEERNDEIRIYEKGAKLLYSVNVTFDFNTQQVKPL